MADITVMTVDWTREQLLAFVGDDAVSCYDRRSDPVPSPAWLEGPDVPDRPPSPGHRLAITHPDDRHRLVELWWDTSRRPGEVREATYRVRDGEADGGWRWEHRRQVNLLPHPEVGAMVAAMRPLHPGERAVGEVERLNEFEAVDVAIYHCDSQGIVTDAEGRVMEISGRRPDEVTGRSLAEQLHPDGIDDAVHLWIEVMAGPDGTARAGRQRVVHPDGVVVPVETTVIRRVGPDGGDGGVTVIAQDSTGRRRQASALRAARAQFRAIAERVPAAVFQTDAELRLVFRNRRWDRLLPPSAVPVEHLGDLVHAADRERFDAALSDLLADLDGDGSVEIEVRSAMGDRVLVISAELVHDLLNGRTTVVGAVTDVTEAVVMRSRSERDSLTGLLNRAALEDHLRALWSTAGVSGDLAVALLDLDGFKEVNDAHGHHIGDLVLVGVADRLLEAVRAGDAVARFGGDHFVVVLQGPDLDSNAVVARLRAALRVPIDWPGGSWRPAANIGVARPDDVAGPLELLRRADQEMRERKRRRREPVASGGSGTCSGPEGPTAASTG